MPYALRMATTIAPIQRSQSAALQAFRSLRSAILQHIFKPNQRLIESELASMLGISRTPVREALSKLEAQGLVELAPAGGVVVRDVSSELLEIYGLRRQIEAFAASLAAKRATEQDLAAIEQACEDARSHVDSLSLEQRGQKDREFHRLVTAASHSTRLLRLFEDYRDYFLEKEMLQFFNRETALRLHDQHRGIVDALRHRDSELAERLTEEHFTTAEVAIVAFVGEPPISP
jgi:DNA-binding GntR family transcriptional regulator